MENSIMSRLKNAWNIFIGNEAFEKKDTGPGYYYQPYRRRLPKRMENTIISAIYNRIAVDVSSVDFRHVRLDDSGRFVSYIEDSLDNCLNLEANIDQTSVEFMRDLVISLLSEGVVAIVPVDTNKDPETGAFEIYNLRVGKIIEWHPYYVKVSLYDERCGIKKEIMVSKASTAIIENPFYTVMNETNSTMQRLIQKLSLLDAVDEQSSSGKLDMIIQLPYIIKTEARRAQAEQRREDIERQLAGSKYGIAYTDGTEHITQLNRPVENNLMNQVEFLTSMLYDQLGMTPEILNGTANEETMLNYTSRIVEPICSVIVLAFRRSFLTKTARTQKESIMYFKDPFKLVPVSKIAEIADKFTRNEIMSSNEVRQIIGMRKSDDPGADELRNKNLNQSRNEANFTKTELPFEKEEAEETKQKELIKSE